MTELKQNSKNSEQKQMRLWPITGKSGRLRNRIIILVLIALTPVLILYSYLNVRAEQQGLEEALLDRAEAIAITGATFVGNSLEEAIASGALTTEQVFDQNYQKFFEFDPANYPEITDDPNIYDKYHTAYDAFADEHWQKFFDSNMTGQDIRFAVASDINGYVPTHNTSFSTGDGNPSTDRTKRIFSDAVGLKASRTESVLQQVYQQSGTGATLWDVSAPIYVNGKQWGGFRVGIQLAQNQVRVQEAASRAVISSAILLAIVAVFAWLLGSYITNPIERLTKASREAASGNLDTQIDIPGRDEITILANSFNQMTTQLRDLIGSLEQRVTDRTKALATSTEVSRRLSTILERKELVTEVVNQVKNSFGYYHTQIYFFDKTNENLVMAGGTGEAGEIMLAQFHKIAKGRGLVGRAANSNKPILVSDTSQNPEWLPNPLLPETKSEAAIPISMGDEVLGVLDVQHNVKDGLQQEDVDVLQSIANQVAVALQNIQSTETVIKRAAELQTVARISTVAATISNIEEMLHEVVQLTQRGFGLYHAHVFTYNENMERLEIVACGYKEGDEHEGTHGTTTIPLEQEQSLVARAARTRQAVIVNDVRNEPGWLPNPQLPATVSELAVPMIVGDQLLGVLDVQSERLNAFTNEDANIQTTLASQVATALQNARTFAQTQHQAERETAVNLITQKIQSATSVEAALKIAARELGHALGMKSTLVTLEPEALTGAGESKSK